MIWGWLTVGGIALLVAAGLSYFHYSQLLNRARLGIAHALQMPSSLADTVQKRWKAPFMSSEAASGSSALRFYVAGQACFVGGGLILFAVVAKMILS